MLNKEQWLEWQNHPVTRDLKAAIHERTQEGHIRILHSTDSQFDQTAKGIILGLQEVLDWQPEFYIDEEDTDEVSERNTST